MRVLGIDPGTLATGWGVVDVVGRDLRHVAHGVVRTRPKDALWLRLQAIAAEVAAVVERHRPATLSLERVFVSKNAQSALKLGHTRGAVMVACVDRGLEVFEYTPGEIKSAVSGSGRADKRQVQEMVRLLLGLPEVAPEDASDALAAAICHASTLAARRAMGGR